MQKKMLPTIENKSSSLDEIQLDVGSRPNPAPTIFPRDFRDIGPADRVLAPPGDPDGMLAVLKRPGGTLFVFWLSDRWRKVLGWSIIGVAGAVVTSKGREIFAGLQALMQSFGGLSAGG